MRPHFTPLPATNQRSATRALLLLASVLSGCGAAATETATNTSTGSTDPTSSTSATPSPTTSASTGAHASTGAADTGAVFIPPQDTLTPACDVWTEDCPEGQKCTPVSLDGAPSWESLMCVPIAPNPAQLGDPCTPLGTGYDGLDTCDLHMICWDVDPDTNTGHCLGLCTGQPENPGCADPNAACVLTDDGLLTLCVPHCDPLAQDCPDKDLCVTSPFDLFFCYPDAGEGGQAFTPCEYFNVCAPGLACLPSELAVECDPMTNGCCLPFCDLTQPNTCPGQAQECHPWFQDEIPPPKLVNVGFCGLPTP